MKYLKKLLWHGQPEMSRLAVLGELRGMAVDWLESAHDLKTEQDAKTLGIIVSIIEDLERGDTDST